MFDIPLVTSASNIVLRKLADSKKFKHSIPQGLLQKYKEATSVRGSNVGVPSGGRQLGDTTRDHQSQQQTSAAREYSIVRENHYTDDGLPHPERRPLAFQQQKSRKRPHAEDYGKSYIIMMVRRILNCHPRTLSLLILDLDFNLGLTLALAFVHLHLTTNHVNTGMMRYSRCLHIIFIPMGIMLRSLIPYRRTVVEPKPSRGFGPWLSLRFCKA
ncbi:hypothetical protein P692DRAFT_20816585 [Suillus brevipes Sb2]|nr:hypothetical protein P692DRAFT_20816585 [Suillus brevipes Sb2]